MTTVPLAEFDFGWGSAQASASGSLDISGTASAKGAATASGSLSVAGSSSAAARVTVAGSISLTGTGPTGAFIPTISGSLAISGAIPGMALVPFSVCGGSAAAGSSTIAVTAGSGIAGATGTRTGDAIVVSLLSNSNLSLPTGVIDSKGNTYVAGPADTARLPCVATYIALNAIALVSGVDTITGQFAGTAAVKDLIARACSGIVTSGAVDQSVNADGNSAAPSVTTSTLSQPLEWAVAALSDGVAGGTPSSWTGGFAAVSTQGAGPFLTVADQVTTGTGAITSSATIASSTWTIATVTLKAAAGVSAVASVSGSLSISGTAAAGANASVFARDQWHGSWPWR